MTTETAILIEIESYNNYNDYRDSDLDWERFSDLVT